MIIFPSVSEHWSSEEKISWYKHIYSKKGGTHFTVGVCSVKEITVQLAQQ